MGLKKHYYIGLMSGTSVDAMDAVLASFDSQTDYPCIQDYVTTKFPLPLRESILNLCTYSSSNSNDQIAALARADIAIADISSQSVLELLTKAGVSKNDIVAIGSHGQTIRHYPEHKNTLQIGSPSHIAEYTGITTVADFRRRDMAAGGQGAPLVPAFHESIFRDPDEFRVIVNIGGMSNISILPRAKEEEVTGFDTGPGNVLLDYWYQKHNEGLYDANGAWASIGESNEKLLSDLLSENYFSIMPPKSTGRELFNAEWLNRFLNPDVLSPVDVQATLTDLTATSISLHIEKFAPMASHIYVCGGGAFNQLLIKRLANNMPSRKVTTSFDLGISPLWVEALAFAWLAKQAINSKPGNLPAVTHASGLRILGGIFPA